MRKIIIKLLIVLVLTISIFILVLLKIKNNSYYNDWILFSISKYDFEEIYIYNPYTKQKINLGLDEFEPNYAIWSPDKKQIAFVGNLNKLMIFSTSCIEKDINCKDKVKEINILDSPYKLHDLEWSNDGTKILYVIDKGGNGMVIESRLEFIDIYKETITRIDINDDYQSNPNWSPDNSKILLDSSHFYFSSQLVEYDLIQKKLEPIDEINNIPENIDKNVADASYSPDGNKIVFTMYEVGDEEFYLSSSIYIYDLKTQKYKKIIYNGEYPEWSVDGSKILFVYKRGDKTNYELFYFDLLEDKEVKVDFIDAFEIKFDWGI